MSIPKKIDHEHLGKQNSSIYFKITNQINTHVQYSLIRTLLISCSYFSKVTLNLKSETYDVAPNIKHLHKLQIIVVFDTKQHKIVWTENEKKKNVYSLK